MKHMKERPIALVLLLAGCSAEPQFQAGRWSYDIETTAEGQRVFWGSGEQCVGQADTADLPAKILGGTAFGNCTTSSSSLKSGKLQISAACDGKSMATTMPESKVSLDGNYAPTNFKASLSARLEADAPVKEMTGTLSARRTGDCSAPQQGNAS